MLKPICLAALAGTTFVAPALANDNIEYPAPPRAESIQRYVYSGQAVVIPPYRHVFPIRIYTTPQREPYYNVPPYPVIAPE